MEPAKASLERKSLRKIDGACLYFDFRYACLCQQVFFFVEFLQFRRDVMECSNFFRKLLYNFSDKIVVSVIFC